MSGTQISDMTVSLTAPAGSYVPFVVTANTGGLVTTANYRYDLGTALAAIDAAIALRPTSATLAASGGSALIGYTYGATNASTRTVQARLRDAVSVADFDSFQHALDYIAANGGTLLVPAGTYAISSQLNLSPTTFTNIHIIGYGAEITTSGAISGFKVSEAFNVPSQWVIEGLKINHRGNATATAGFEATHAVNGTFRNCVVEAHGVGAGYAAFWMHQSDPTDAATGCFWINFEDCTVRKRDSSPGDIPYGIKAQGACNASMVVRGFYHNCDIGIGFTTEAGQTDISNGFVIDGTAFETDTTAISVVAATTDPISGLKIVNCRAESVTTFLTLAGATTQPAVPPFLAGNYLVPGVTTYLDNANDLYVNSLDTQPSIVLGMELSNYGKLLLRNVSGSGSTLEAWASATGQSMIDVRDNAGNQIGFWRWVSSNIVELTGSNDGTLALTTIRGISGTGTRANNLRGTATFAAATTVAVAFGTNESDANYTVQLTPKADPVGRLWTSSLATTGFTINNSSSTSIAVDWLLIR